ncbi:MAG: ribonuclease HI [candidate division WOR-3 bacterium]
MEYKLYFDGACELANPGGFATYGFVVFRDKELVKSENGIACEPFSTCSTNNYAEYTAMIKGLKYCVNNGISELSVKGDSKLIINQMNGIYDVKSQNIIPLFQKAKSLSQQFKKISYIWIPREQNRFADRLSKDIYKNIVRKGLFKNIDTSLIKIPFGKYKGKTFEWLVANQKSYLFWLLEQSWISPDWKSIVAVVLEKSNL